MVGSKFAIRALQSVKRRGRVLLRRMRRGLEIAEVIKGYQEAVTDGDLMCLALVGCEIGYHTFGMKRSIGVWGPLRSRDGSRKISLSCTDQLFMTLLKSGHADGRNAEPNLHINTRKTDMMTQAIGATVVAGACAPRWWLLYRKAKVIYSPGTIDELGSIK